MTSLQIEVIDSHTGGEPTRIVIAGGPDLGGGTLSDRRARFSANHDAFRSAVVNEPRGSDVLVGGLLCEPHAAHCNAGVIFFNNVGMLGMCGHGTIGLVATLHAMGQASLGTVRIDTPVGVVEAELLSPNRVAVTNVASYRLAAKQAVDVPDYGVVYGDIAWGGNWFFLTDQAPCELTLDNVSTLTAYTTAIRAALEAQQMTGGDGEEIDHIEVFGPARCGGDGRNFVLCPGLAYDRSPCGTGTSAKLACLAADGKLRPGEVWRQESIIGSVFEAAYEATDDGVLPRIVGEAHVTSRATLQLGEADPFQWGITRDRTS